MTTPIQFDKKESDLMYDKELFPLKRKVNQKIYTLFEQIRLGLKDTDQHKQFVFPVDTDINTGKISQGENYEGFPWVILDFPKLFKQDNYFSFRTMFWYGHYFSCSFVISGNHAAQYLGALVKNFEFGAGVQIYFTIVGDPWQHKIDTQTCKLLTDMEASEMKNHFEAYGFLKISVKFNETESFIIKEKAINCYILFLKLLSSSPDSNH